MPGGGRVFWGVLFLVLGVFTLLVRTDVFEASFAGILKLWPLLLVLWGSAVLSSNVIVKRICVGLAAAWLALVIVEIFRFNWIHCDSGDDREPVVQELREPYHEGIHHAKLTMDFAAGSLQVDDTSDDLVAVSARSSIGAYQLFNGSEDGTTWVHVRQGGGRIQFRCQGVSNRVEVRLHRGPVWDINVDVGAARADLDLSSFKVEHVSIDAGAAAVRLRLGVLHPNVRVHVNAGVSTVRLAVPEESGVEARLDTPLSRKRLRDFIKIDSKTYRTENFDRAENRVLITVDAGVSRLEIDRY